MIINNSNMPWYECKKYINNPYSQKPTQTGKANNEVLTAI